MLVTGANLLQTVLQREETVAKHHGKLEKKQAKQLEKKQAKQLEKKPAEQDE
jgi:hypothetical protein